MSGRVLSLDTNGCRGRAWLPAVPRYPVTVHLLLDGVVRCSCIADQDGQAEDDGSTTADWFAMDVPEDALQRRSGVEIMIGETAELLDFPSLDTPDDIPRNGSGAIVTPAASKEAVTYRDALAKGLDAVDVSNLLYLDILHRPSDPGGLATQLSDLASGRTSFDLIRKTMLASPEYRQLRLKKAVAPGRIFARPLVGRSSGRRIHFERHVVAFQRSSLPIAQKLLRFFPGLLIRPASLELLEKVAAKGMPDREVFCRALSALSDLPALILPDLPERLPNPTTALEANQNEALVPSSSKLFSLGWHRAEGLNSSPFRWMSHLGVILNPCPDRRILRIEVQANAWYGTLSRVVVTASEKGRMALSRVEQDDGGCLLVITGGEAGDRADYVVLAAAEATCPIRHDSSPDPRLLSFNVAHALFVFQEDPA